MAVKYLAKFKRTTNSIRFACPMFFKDMEKGRGLRDSPSQHHSAFGHGHCQNSVTRVESCKLRKIKFVLFYLQVLNSKNDFCIYHSSHLGYCTNYPNRAIPGEHEVSLFMVFRPPSDGGLMIPPWTKND